MPFHDYVPAGSNMSGGEGKGYTDFVKDKKPEPKEEKPEKSEPEAKEPMVKDEEPTKTETPASQVIKKP